MIKMLAGVLGALLLAMPVFARPLAADDFYQLQRVGDPHLSPDGVWIVYTVTRRLRDGDKQDQDLWLARWNGKESLQLTNSLFSEHSARWSPDGKSIAFLTDRGGEREGDQVWVLNRAGGEAKQLSHFSSEITSFAWSPDGSRVVFSAEITPPEHTDTSSPKPIVLDRLQFKSDDDGYLRGERTHLFLLDVATGETKQLTDGTYDEIQPSWSPDGAQIAFLSKRGDDPDRHNNWDIYLVEPTAGATPRQLTTHPGTDGDPTEDWGSRPPEFSADGKQLTYVSAGKPEDMWYSLVQVSTILVAGSEGALPAADLDRQSFDPVWSGDSKFLYFRLEDDGSIVLAKLRLKDGKVERLTQEGAVVSEFDIATGRKAKDHTVVVSETSDRPPELYAVEKEGELRALSHHNDAWLADVQLAQSRMIQFRSASDGETIHGLMMMPEGSSMASRQPTILRLHGGPVAQFQFDFDFEWQMLAANGYVVVGPNPRGSSGRGYEYQKALFAEWGTVDVPDVLAAADYVVSIGIGDADRMAVGGWSYGAILTNYVIATDSRFKAATSGAGMGNMLAAYGDDQYVREWEVELGLPWEHPEAWMHVSSAFFHADRIKTPTLFLVGAEDHNVPPIGAEQMYQALRRLRVPTQLVIYPGERHGLMRPSFRVDRVNRYLEWYGRYLKPG